jgi:hypothetical protein
MSKNTKLEEFIKKSTSSTRYRAWEKLEHETNMRLKAFFIENAVYLAPFFILNSIYFIYGLIKEASTPFNQHFTFFNITYLIILILSLIATFLNIKYIKPLLSKEIQQSERELTEDVYVEGNRLINTHQFNNCIDKYIEKESKLKNRDNKIFLIQTTNLDKNDKLFEKNSEPIKIPSSVLSTGLCISGSPGQGKSVLINQIVNQIPSLKKSIIIDVKGEFVESFFNPDKDLIICPADIRSAKFNLFELIRTKIDAGVIAEILVPDDKYTQDPHWVNAARAVIEGLLIFAAKNKLSNTDIYKYLTDFSLLEKIKKDEEVYPIVANFIRNDNEGHPSKETQSIISTAIRKAKALQYLSYLDDLNTQKINFKKWLFDNNGGKLFLLSTENLNKVFAPLYGVITSYLISTILDEKDNFENEFYFILDELPQLGKALGENLEKGLAVGRSKGLKFVMALQDFNQLKKSFGEQETNSILATTNSFIVFQNFYGAQHLEKFFGKTTIIRNDESFTFSQEPMGDRVSISRKKVTENLINDAKIQRLEKFEFYAKIEGCKDVLKAKLAPVFINKKIVERFVENKNMLIQQKILLKNIKNRFVNLNKTKKGVFKIISI